MYTKSILAHKYKVSPSTLRKLLNDTFFEELKDLGYKKTCQILTPDVVRKFVELYGKPLNDEEI